MTGRSFRLAFHGPRESRPAFWILAALVLVVPLFIWPTAQDSYVLPKEVLLRMGTLLLAGGVLAAAALGLAVRVPLQPVNLLLLVYAAWQWLSVLWAEAPALAIDEATRTSAFVVLAFAFQTIVMDDRRRIIALATLFVGSATLVALWVLALDFLQAFAPGTIVVRQTLGDWRDALSTASLGNTSHIGDLLVAAFLVALGMLVSVRGRWLVLAVLVALWVLAAALIVVWSLHSNFSLIIGSLLWVWMMREWLSTGWVRRRLSRVLFAAIGWLVVVLFFVVDHPVNPHGSAVWHDEAVVAGGGELPDRGGIFAQAFSSSRWKEGGPTRLAIWLNTLEMIRERPVLGWGAGTFTFVYPAVKSEIALQDESLAPYVGLWTNAAHNEVLQTWSETGPVGMFLLLALVGVALFTLLRSDWGRSFGNDLLRATTLAMLVAWLLQAMMNFPLELPMGMALFVVLLSVPVVIPGRGGQWNLDMPVERPYPGIRLGIMLRNMRTPLEIRAAGNLGEMGNRVAAGVFAVLALGLAAWAAMPLAASSQYRPVYEAIRTPGFWESEVRIAAAKVRARRALGWWPGYADCRSALTEILVRHGEHEEALKELTQLKRRLNATEVFIREALSHEGLGDLAAADKAWAVVFERQPQWASAYSQAYERFLAARVQGRNGEGASDAP